MAQPAVWRLKKGCQQQHRLSGPGPCPLEKLFYQRSLSLLRYGGVLVFIVPAYVLDAELVGWLTRHGPASTERWRHQFKRGDRGEGCDSVNETDGDQGRAQSA